MNIDLFHHPQEAALIATIVAIALGILYYAIRATVRRRRPSILLPEKPYRQILLPFEMESPPSPQTVRMVAQLVDQAGKAGASGNALRLACILTVPRALPLDAPMPDMEGRAREIIDTLQSEVRAMQAGLHVSDSVRRARSFSEDVIRATKDSPTDLLILTADRLPIVGDIDSSDSSGDLLYHIEQRVSCETLLLRPALSTFSGGFSSHSEQTGSQSAV